MPSFVLTLAVCKAYLRRKLSLREATVTAYYPRPDTSYHGVSPAGTPYRMAVPVPTLPRGPAQRGDVHLTLPPGLYRVRDCDGAGGWILVYGCHLGIPLPPSVAYQVRDAGRAAVEAWVADPGRPLPPAARRTGYQVRLKAPGTVDRLDTLDGRTVPVPWAEESTGTRGTIRTWRLAPGGIYHVRGTEQWGRARDQWIVVASDARCQVCLGRDDALNSLAVALQRSPAEWWGVLDQLDRELAAESKPVAFGGAA
ncbi:MAG: hypothetical protein WC789_10540 [Lentisphaeria bacterium]